MEHPLLTPAAEKTLERLLAVFLEENAKLNLSALRTEDACRIGNVDDSLAFLELIDKRSLPHERMTLLDVGTGGGFPLLPLAITLPQWHFIGLDSTKKKIDAIGRMAKALDLKNIVLRADRAETAGRDPTLRERSDIVTARAVAKIPELLEYCSAFVKVGGLIVLWKSVHSEEEIKQSAHAQRALHCPLKETLSYTLDGDFGSRQLLVFEKVSPISDKYPRMIGEAKKNPIV